MGSGSYEVPVSCSSSFLSLAEAPEEPSIQVNALGIPINSREPEEVRYARVGRW